MITRKPIPELDQAIEAHARAFLAGDREASERFVADRGLETHRAAMDAAAKMGPLETVEILARAKIGHQYIAKVRLIGPRGKFVSQNRWNREGDRGWAIVEVEDLSGKRSSWSDIPPLAAMRSGDGRA